MLVHACLDLLIDGESGIWHLANEGAVSWAEFAQRAAVLAGFDPTGIRAVPAAALRWTARRPAYSVLGSERASLLRSLDEALSAYWQERAASFRADAHGGSRRRMKSD
jgi:dTDP-4-dehydrorhamnose reductase